MTNFSIRLDGLDELRRRTDPQRFRQVVERGLQAAAIHLEGEVKERTPVRTGRLRSSITHGGSGLRRTVGTDVKYARFVEAGQGRGPQGTRLRGGSLIVRKRVHHPGTKGAHMFERAARESLGDLTRIISAQISRALGGGT